MAQSSTGKFLSETPSWAKGIIAVAALGGIAYVVIKSKGAIKNIVNPEPTKKFDIGNPKSNPFQFSGFLQYADSVAKDIAKAPRLTYASVSGKVDQIYNAKGFFNDDESTILVAFRDLRNKIQVAQVAQGFSLRYSKDLYQFLRDMLSDSEMNEVLDIITAKPDYFIK
jgi:hypothetical protein